MATVRTVLIVCDVCGDESRHAEPWRITPPGKGKGNRTRTVDLCDEHALGVRRALDPKARKGVIRRRETPQDVTADTKPAAGVTRG